VCLCVWDTLERVWGSDCRAGGFVVCVCMCGVCLCVWDKFERVWWSEFAAGDLMCGYVSVCLVCVCVCGLFVFVWFVCVCVGGVQFGKSNAGSVCSR